MSTSTLVNEGLLKLADGFQLITRKQIWLVRVAKHKTLTDALQVESQTKLDHYFKVN